MSISVDNLSAMNEELKTVQTGAKNIAYRAYSDGTLERMPETDLYEKKKSGKTVGIIAGLVAAAALVIAGICYHKGKPAEGIEKKFGERMKDGWKELCNKGKKAAEDCTDKTKEETEKAIKEAEGKEIYETLKSNLDGHLEVYVYDEKSLELTKMAEYYAEESENAARAFEKEVDEAVNSIIRKEREAFDKKAAEAQAYYDNLIYKPSNKLACGSAEIFEAALAGDLNYEVKVGSDRIIVEKGAIKKCINADGKEWYIKANTDKEYVAKINKEVEQRTDKILEARWLTQIEAENAKIEEQRKKRFEEMLSEDDDFFTKKLFDEDLNEENNIFSSSSFFGTEDNSLFGPSLYPEDDNIGWISGEFL